MNGDVRVRDLLSDVRKVESFIVEEIPSAGSAMVARKCRIRLYDPKTRPVAANDRSVRNGQVAISIYVS